MIPVAPEIEPMSRPARAAVPWVVGLLLLLRRDVVRRIGVGLLASGLLLPVFSALSPANLLL